MNFRNIVSFTLLLCAFVAHGQSSKPVGGKPPYMAAPKATAEDKAQYAKAQKDQAAAKAAFLKKPKDASLKKKYVEATAKFGTVCMTTNVLERKAKYAMALRYYREALKVDPKNEEALNNKGMIERIYTQMGRPIPKD